MRVHYILGDATNPAANGTDRPTVIAHCCNDRGAWGAGFVLPLAQRYPHARTEYLAWHRLSHRPGPDGVMPMNRPAARPPKTNHAVLHTGYCRLDRVQFVAVDRNPRRGVWVANMVAQVLGDPSGLNIRYLALSRAMKEVGLFALREGAVVQMPRLGVGLAGGDWATVAQIIEEEITARGVEAYVVTLPSEAARWPGSDQG